MRLARTYSRTWIASGPGYHFEIPDSKGMSRTEAEAAVTPERIAEDRKRIARIRANYKPAPTKIPRSYLDRWGTGAE